MLWRKGLRRQSLAGFGVAERGIKQGVNYSGVADFSQSAMAAGGNPISATPDGPGLRRPQRAIAALRADSDRSHGAMPSALASPPLICTHMYA